MKSLTTTTVWEFLDSIREKTRSNIIQIRDNSTLINSLTSQMKIGEANNTSIINDLKERNQFLSDENDKLLDLHKSIITLGEKHNLYTVEDIMSKPEDEEADHEQQRILDEQEFVFDEQEDMVQLAFDGKLDYESTEFLQADDKKIEAIYQALVTSERYEDCSRIIELRKKRNKIDDENGANAYNKLLFWKK